MTKSNMSETEKVVEEEKVVAVTVKEEKQSTSATQAADHHQPHQPHQPKEDPPAADHHDDHHQKSGGGGGGGEGGGGGGGATKEKKMKGITMKLILFPLTMFCFLLSLPILFSVIWLLYMRQCDCEDLLKLPKLQFGIVMGLALVFLVSNGVVYLRGRFPMPGLLLVLVPLIVMFTAGLALAGAYGDQSRTVIGSPSWLKREIRGGSYWNNIKSCIYDAQICNDLAARSYKIQAGDFPNMKMSSIESGCCVPPRECDKVYVNATYWLVGNGSSAACDQKLSAGNGTAAASARKSSAGNSSAAASDQMSSSAAAPHDPDCDMWSNDNRVLCYNCHSCKQGFLATLLGKWRRLGVFLVVMSLLLILNHLLLFAATMWDQYGG